MTDKMQQVIRQLDKLGSLGRNRVVKTTCNWEHSESVRSDVAKLRIKLETIV